MPRVFVQRSALAPTTATALLVDKDRLKLSEPSGDQSMPLLPLRVDCLAVTGLPTAEAFSSWIVSVVGEKRSLIGPAPATMVERGALMFVFHRRLTL